MFEEETARVGERENQRSEAQSFLPDHPLEWISDQAHMLQRTEHALSQVHRGR